MGPRVLSRCCSFFSRLSTATSFEVSGRAAGTPLGGKGAANGSFRVFNDEKPPPPQQDQHPTQGSSENAVLHGPPPSELPQHVRPQSRRLQQQEDHLQGRQRKLGEQPPQHKRVGQGRQGSAALQEEHFLQDGLQQAPKLLLSQLRLVSELPQQLSHVHEEARLTQLRSIPPTRSHNPLRLFRLGDTEVKIKKMQPWQRMLHWQQEWLRQKRWIQKYRRQQGAQPGQHCILRMRQSSSKRFTQRVIMLQQGQQLSSLEDGQPIGCPLPRSFCIPLEDHVAPLPRNREYTVEPHKLQVQQNPQRAHRYVQTALSPVQDQPCVALRRQHMSLATQTGRSERQTQLQQRENSPTRLPPRSPSVCSSTSGECILNRRSERVCPDPISASASEGGANTFSEQVENSDNQRTTKPRERQGVEQRAVGTDNKNIGTPAEKRTSCEDTDTVKEKEQNSLPRRVGHNITNIPEVKLQADTAEPRFALPDGTSTQSLSHSPASSSAAPPPTANRAREEAPLFSSIAHSVSVGGRIQEKEAQKKAGACLSPRDPDARHFGSRHETYVHAEQREDHGQQDDKPVAAGKKEPAESKQQRCQHWQALRQGREDHRQRSECRRGKQGDRHAHPEESSCDRVDDASYTCPLTGSRKGASPVAVRLRELPLPWTALFGSNPAAAAATAVLRKAVHAQNCAGDFEHKRGCVAAEELLDSILRGRRKLYGYPSGTTDTPSSNKWTGIQCEGSKPLKEAGAGANEKECLWAARERCATDYNIYEGKQDDVGPRDARSSSTSSRKVKKRCSVSRERCTSAETRIKREGLRCTQRRSSCCRCRRHLRRASTRDAVGASASELAAAPSTKCRQDFEKLSDSAHPRRACRARRGCSRRKSHRRHHHRHKHTSHRTRSYETNGARRSCCCSSRKAARSRHRRLYRGLMHILQLASSQKQSTGSAACFASQTDRSSGVFSLPRQQIVTREDIEYAAERAEAEAVYAAALKEASGLDIRRNLSRGIQTSITAQRLRLLFLLSPEREKASVTDEDQAAIPASLQDHARTTQSSSNALSANTSDTRPSDLKSAVPMLNRIVQSQQLSQCELVDHPLGPEHELAQLHETAEEVTEVLQLKSLTSASMQPVEAQLPKQSQQAMTQEGQQEGSLLHKQDCTHSSVQQLQRQQGPSQKGTVQQPDQKCADIQQGFLRQEGHTQELQQSEIGEGSIDVSETKGTCSGGSSAAPVAGAHQQEAAADPVVSEEFRRRDAQRTSPRAVTASDKELCNSEREIYENSHTPRQMRLSQEAEEVRLERHRYDTAKPQAPRSVAEEGNEAGEIESVRRAEIKRHESQTCLNTLGLDATLASEKKQGGHSPLHEYSPMALDTQNVPRSDGQQEGSKLSQQECGPPRQKKQSRPHGQSECQHLDRALLPPGHEQRQQKSTPQENLPAEKGTEVRVGEAVVKTCAADNLTAPPTSGRSFAFNKLHAAIFDYRERFMDRLLQREPVLRRKMQEYFDIHKKNQSKELNASAQREELSCTRRAASTNRAASHAETQKVSSERCSDARQHKCSEKELKGHVEATNGKEGTNDALEDDAQQLHTVLQANGSWAVSASVAEEFLQEYFEEAVEQIEERLAAAVEDLVEQEQRTLLAISSAKSSGVAAVTTCL